MQAQRSDATEVGGLPLHISGVSKQFAGNSGVLTALEPVSLDVAAGEFVCLLGPSGCGKSTLLNIISGLDAPTTGEVRVGGKTVTGPGPDRVLLFQEAALFPWLDVQHNVEFGLRQRGVPRKERAELARELLGRVHLQGFEKSFVHQLSGGMRQRVAIARALAIDPAVLLMDEPFGAVDPPTRERLQDEFLKLQSELRKTVLFVTHDLEEAVKISDRICLMNVGQVEQYDTPEVLLRSPKTPFVQDFLGPSRTLLRLSRIPLNGLVEPLGTHRPAVSIKRSAMARDAFSLLLANGIRNLGVTDEGGQVVGLVRLESLLAAASEEDAPAAPVRSESP